jgi:hypothetical protein
MADRRPKSENAVEALMRAFRIPLTRENYLNLNYLGKPPKVMSPEEEAELPVRFQLPFPTIEEQVAEQQEKEKESEGGKK